MISRKRSYGFYELTNLESDICVKQGKLTTLCAFAQFMDNAPHEVVLQITELLERKDLLKLASTSKQLRNQLLPYIFDKVKCSWHDLLHDWKSPCGVCAPISCPQLVETMRISTSCSKNEWAFPFHVLFDPVTRMINLKSLELPTSGSTNFFKYCNTVPFLLSLRVDAERSDSEFSLEHIQNFPALQELALSNFRIEDYESTTTDLCPNLKSVTLINCTWSYPFSLESFGKDKITVLHLIYSSSFIISERFRHFLSCPGFTRLEELWIVNNENNLRLTISVQIMTLIRAMPSLKVLKLAGNVYNEALIRATGPKSPNHTNVVAVQDVKILYSSFLRDIR
ncbi:LAME_0G03246g1_1 [Lachancea meyersii CBS 8951]|uniref:LAME_0G03246g1_1 n=1 Tax=Lachancea meyersii CBS 8951 TaxID=1266667 RepID=A0A1G4K6K8_9SACH|nr:LAME_0G03246g1_1 [Lachancea meyersii CBS 8951]